ncbi:transcription elongation factor SPT6 homolog [Cynara cardunculus var. scolymus]|uniref:transcription elongation factor SPT6 homolog n=1 Tax=Cynara cardunculus var. scolymus TaxID=59895 RepID=UPI000D626AC7|nr:transcription elongation factor SPT6 homolog [Cynara cardunculus var. scolymus]
MARKSRKSKQEGDFTLILICIYRVFFFHFALYLSIFIFVYIDGIEVEVDEMVEPEYVDEDDDEFEKDGFIVDDLDEEEDLADGDDGKQKKRRKKRESNKNYLLDEDEYELLEDNFPGFSRPKLGSENYKRLKKARMDADEGPSMFFDEEEYDRRGRARRTAEEKLKRTIFGDDDGSFLEDSADEQLLNEDKLLGEEDEMADFIVDEVETDEHGGPLRKAKVDKKKSRQAPGVSSSSMQGANDIFGDLDDLLIKYKLEPANVSRYDEATKLKEKKLEDEFEPIILSDKYMTKKDDHIRKIDIPERIQISEESTGPRPTDDTSIHRESDWILNQLRMGMVPWLVKGGSRTTEEGNELSILKDDVKRFLELIHVEKLDVPFIAMYRKEECNSLFKDQELHEGDEESQHTSDQKPILRWHKVLWTILELDRKWLLFQKRKSALQLYYNKRFEEEQSIYDETRLHLDQKFFESITKSLKVAETEREIDDVDSKFNLHFPPGEVVVEKGEFKRPTRKSQYGICSEAELREVASKFGYNSEEFGLRISLEQMRMDELEDAKETPEEVASRFTCAKFENPQAVLKGARHMAAVEISCEPFVRKHVRRIFMDNATLSTSPTAEGNVDIDSRHQFAGIKWLRDKPLTKFEDAQWLLIQKAEEEKLIEVSIKLPTPIHDQLINDARDFYLSGGVSKSSQLWNEQRKQILKDAFDDFLIPSMEKEARALLISRAKSWLLMEYGRVLWNKVCVAPYQKKGLAPRVLACCWGPGRPATTFVMLDSFGEVLDVLYAGSLSVRGQSVNDQQRKKNDQQRIVKFMADHLPDVVVLGAVNVPCSRLKEDIYEIICKMVEDNSRDVGHNMDGVSVVYGDESLPRLYENSHISSEQLQSRSGIVKRAVSLGRYLQNPLAMAATLCGSGKEILSWKLSPLQSFITSDEKYGMVEQVMVDVTNQVGLDVNLAVNHEWLFAPLQFISGLGPMKAASLQRSLVRAGCIYSRKDLLNHGLGRRVFINAVGFLRVRGSGNATSSSQFIDLLDDTRIHPESYSLAQELAKDIYRADAQDDVNDDDDDMLETAIEHVRENPNLLKSLEVDAYAKSKKRETKKDTLSLIKQELIHGFQDWRREYVEPSQDEEFCMISGETENSLAEGRTVRVTIRRVLPQRAICNLESGLSGMLNKEDYSDDCKDDDLTERLKEGDILTCKIKSIAKDRYQVFLSCRENDMKSDWTENSQAMDPYYHEVRDTSVSVKEKPCKVKELAKKLFKPRMIVHPRFKNVTIDEALELLSEKELGESILRPSSRGPSYLTLTLKVYNGVYAHKDILEGGKDHTDITSLLHLGKTLKIGEDVFTDLDEVSLSLRI